ncbi:MAG: hypothetical protein OZ948_15915 [Deltaproteobacteria bacterium]|nr:hypothetical protein [Deltaproteobacteria bacterium]
MDAPSPSWLVPLGVGIGFVALWVGIFQLLGRVGGWRELARAYPPLGIVSAGIGETFRMRSLRLRARIDYNGCVTFTAGPSALRLSLPRPLAFGHPPIEVPWSELRAEAGRALWVPVVTLRCARAPAIPLRMRRALAESLARASGGQLRLPAEGEAA